MQKYYKQYRFISDSSGEWKSEIRVLVCLSSGEDLLLGCRFLISHFILTWWRAERAKKLPFDFLRTLTPFVSGSILMTSSYPNYLSRSHFLIPSYLVSIVSTYDLEVGRPKYSVHNEANMKSFCSCCWPPPSLLHSYTSDYFFCHS